MDRQRSWGRLRPFAVLFTSKSHLGLSVAGRGLRNLVAMTQAFAAVADRRLCADTSRQDYQSSRLEPCSISPYLNASFIDELPFTIARVPLHKVRGGPPRKTSKLQEGQDEDHICCTMYEGISVLHTEAVRSTPTKT
ncbi:unnamed protein product [Protopolystoma xenopodis]|uniref:Uncharacterized protein n=1 Tax=Protopolystoma xenopodis TaxID=117903 RepID=A0A3S5CKD7_9PLAT|nr:unnamed protein product [Protopolystoma xenopodis]